MQAEAIDGRSARAARTRDAVVRAVLDLVREGNPRPTARQIADRAGISLRSVYVHFDDLEDLFVAAAHRHFESLGPLLEPVDARLDLRERIAAFAEQRFAIWEHSGPVRRAAAVWAPSSPALTEVLRQGRALARRDTDRLFGAETRGRVEGPAMLEAVHVLGGPATWDSLCTDEGLAPARARAVVVAAVTRLLEDR